MLPDNDVPPVDVRKLCKTMNGHAVLGRIDLSIAAGEVVALVGANGAGKSTLLRCLTNQLRPTSGEVRWFGTSPERRPDRHHLVGFAGHETYLYAELTALENLVFAARMHRVANLSDRVVDLLEQSGLQKWANQSVGKMSRGMKQRLSVARAIVHDPPIVVLDEPFNGLDCDGRDWLERTLARLRGQRRAVCFSSHDREQCYRIADRIVEIRGGRAYAVTNESSSEFPRLLPVSLAGLQG